MKLEASIGDKPLWSQLYDILSQRIEKSYYKVGDIMPTEMQLMEEFGVSRITVRQAMDKLLSENKISRKRGKGTIVLEKPDKISTIFQSSFLNLKENEEGWVRTLDWVRYEKAPLKVSEFFQIPKDSIVLCIMRQSETDQHKVIARHLSYISPIVGMSNRTDFTQSLYAQYKNYGYSIERVSEEITASIATEEEKKEFEIENQTIALMNRVRKGYHGNLGVEYSISKYLSDGYTLFINND